MRLTKTVVAATAVYGALLMGCSIDSSPKLGTSGVQHDVAPLAERFKAVGKPTSATWIEITWCPANLDRTVPGPCDSSVNAIIELEPAVAQSLRAKYLSHEDPWTIDPLREMHTDPDAPTKFASARNPELGPELKAKLPLGTYEYSEALHSAVRSGRNLPHLHTTKPILVIGR
ncbi:hypothetical protein [Gordonia araii]|nr:hypothetical protein [Gordonia araii]NNG97692.1 hypothetical protein [Gordonia araii NBRC 100433]